ncbi:serine/threonine protein kinase [Limnoglobus roseus]|uniref:non-specific serine/threonine protein kinase n=1 Tax=Limnoglobus roseus TaxID=2598579 RepID=A0A5C1ABP8_9BACT|nr:serine/threonine-protein kinase [Limnoglobus roseus]QEL15222.1 serine/threonine protein kinase [Limnoglobus roseus]
MGFLSSLFGGGKKKQPGINTKGMKRADFAKRWDLRGRTGQGSMSKVFQAYDKTLGRTVCLKLMDKEKTRKFEARFTQVGLIKPPEGEICMALQHPNCVRSYEFGLTTKGEPYLVMEWIEGLGLNYLVETKSAQLNGKRIDYLGQLADSVQYLHDCKYLHRDLCPRNVMVDKEGVVKLIDFGLTIPYTPPFCQPGNRTGTLDILAPEIINRRRTDHRVDVFALGVTAFEVITGQLPWERSVSSEENLRRRMNLKPRNPKDLAPDLDDDVQDVLLKAIAKEPVDRYGSAKEFKEALLGVKNQGL